MSTSRMIALSHVIAENTHILDTYFTKKGLPTPSFDIDGPPRLSIPYTEPEAFAAHVAILSATEELHQLVKGPTSVLMSIDANDCVSLEAIYRFKIASALPVGEQWSFEDLSTATGLNVVDLRRLLRYAMCNHIFVEPQPGFVAHTAASRLLAENKLVQDFVGISMEEKFPSQARTVDALIRYDGRHEPNETGFSLGHDTDKGLYEEMDAHPARGQRWAGAMSAFAATIPLDPLIASVDWASFASATMVDIGGGWGPVSLGIAQKFPDLRFIVQDLSDTVAEGLDKVPTELQHRFEFMSYNFLNKQPIKGAAIYFFRAIFHNWPDHYCVRILRNQIPALKPSARIIINDVMLHEPNTLPPSLEKQRRNMDLSMLTYFNSRERTISDWEQLLKDADSRFYLRNAVKLPHNTHFVLDIEWRP